MRKLNDKNAWTLRDLRRAIGRIEAGSYGPAIGEAVVMGILRPRGLIPNSSLGRHLAAALDMDESRLMKLDFGMIAREIDRLISTYGPDYCIRPEAKRTDHKTGSEEISDGPHCTQDSTHGGDGNSGECDEIAQAAAEPERRGGEEKQQKDGNTPDSQSGQDSCQDGLEDEATWASGQDAAKAQAKAGTQPTGGGGRSGVDEATEGMGSQSTDGAAGADESRGGDAAPAMGAGRDNQCTHHAKPDILLDGQPDAGARQLVALAEMADRLAAAGIARAIERMIDRVGARTQYPTPKYNPRDLIRELVARRMALHRARETQRRPVHILIMADISGSCEWVAHITHPIAIEAARRANVSAAETVVGDFSSISGPLSRVMKDYYSVGMEAEWRAMLNAGLRHLLVFGDGHGAHSYAAAAAAGIRVYWVDPNPSITYRHTVVDYGGPYSSDSLDDRKMRALCSWMAKRGIRYEAMLEGSPQELLRATLRVI